MSDPQNHTRENEVDKEKVSGRNDERVVLILQTTDAVLLDEYFRRFAVYLDIILT